MGIETLGIKLDMASVTRAGQHGSSFSSDGIVGFMACRTSFISKFRPSLCPPYLMPCFIFFISLIQSCTDPSIGFS